MRICFRPYKRRDGLWMLYINNQAGVFLGVSPDKGIGDLTSLDKLQRRLIRAAAQAVVQNGDPFEGDLNQHADKSQCAEYCVAWSCNGEIGGHAVQRDGAHVIALGFILPCERWYFVNKTGVRRPAWI